MIVLSNLKGGSLDNYLIEISKLVGLFLIDVFYFDRVSIPREGKNIPNLVKILTGSSYYHLTIHVNNSANGKQSKHWQSMQTLTCLFARCN